jgi:hypothetical protein
MDEMNNIEGLGEINIFKFGILVASIRLYERKRTR